VTKAAEKVANSGKEFAYSREMNIPSALFQDPKDSENDKYVSPKRSGMSFVFDMSFHDFHFKSVVKVKLRLLQEYRRSVRISLKSANELKSRQKQSDL
jgi:hypothetical protein